MPDGVKNDRADELAKRMMNSVDAEAWNRTQAITWTFADRNNHLWDRKRRFVRVRSDDREVFVNLHTKKGVAFEDGQKLEGEDHDEAVEEAYAAWVNDSFWLTAMNKAFDGGTTRSVVKLEDRKEGLLVQYSSGGVTPGDAYLWHFDDKGRPVEWQMWVSNIPVDGVSATWEDWSKLPTGAYVSRLHEIGPVTIKITELDAAESLDKLVEGPDPFAVLVK